MTFTTVTTYVCQKNTLLNIIVRGIRSMIIIITRKKSSAYSVKWFLADGSSCLMIGRYILIIYLWLHIIIIEIHVVDRIVCDIVLYSTKRAVTYFYYVNAYNILIIIIIVKYPYSAVSFIKKIRVHQFNSVSRHHRHVLLYYSRLYIYNVCTCKSDR